MCGVIGLIYERQRADLGRVAAELLKTLEYRGYDSTGAAVQGAGTEVTLVKGVGAPSLMVDELGIVDLEGQILCGQVRWATFGAVDDTNAQPHLVRCRETVYGAHNGNVTNCDALKAWLTAEGHAVRSDNDGEMVVHTVEHFFALELERHGAAARGAPEVRRAAMRAALVRAAARLEGSYAAVVVDPASRALWAVKQGSSLYLGIGQDGAAGRFGIASSDLSSVLKLTRVVVPLVEGEMVELDAAGHQLWAVADHALKGPRGAVTVAAGEPVERAPVRSRLRARDTALLPPFATFMEQEICAQEQACRDVVALLEGGSADARALRPHLAGAAAADRSAVREQLDRLLDEVDDDRIRRGFADLVGRAELGRLLERVPPALAAEVAAGPPERIGERLASSETGFLVDLLPLAAGQRQLLAVRVLDALLEVEEADEYAAAVDGFCRLCRDAAGRGGRLYAVACGSSFHAAKAGALFFNEIASSELLPILPGEFRGQCAGSLRDGDVLIAISQSGETKDLVDVLNDAAASPRDVRVVALVNNVSSTLAQEKSDLVIPLRCGPEIAVPATKSFMNQVAVLYGLALALAERRLAHDPLPEPERAAAEAALERRRERLRAVPELIRATFDATGAAVEEAAQLMYLRPSLHILATRLSAVAREGALKVREVVLNHCEGFEGSEFKHGPNTILGFNTLFGPAEVGALLREVGRTVDELLRRAAAADLGAESMRRLARAVTDSVFQAPLTSFALTADERALLEATLDRPALVDSLYADYPLVYVTGPDERDVNLTVSQVNTHKIRGASTVVVAEDHPALRAAAAKAPADNPHYRWVYVTLPHTDDTLMTVFSATVVLQRLALEMSLLKAAHLDRLGVRDHGVHPDVPKNVSKSITVD